ncbi:MAG: hypothetical protein FJ280_15020, partial [Planctomycetes bacterium]|nr:hypothetical protein [Planctomycetota bacterium]
MVFILVAVTASILIWRFGYYTPEPPLPAGKPGGSRSLPSVQRAAAAEPKVAPSPAGAQPAGEPAGKSPAASDPKESPAPAAQPPAAGDTQEKTAAGAGNAAGASTPAEPPAPKPEAQKPPTPGSSPGAVTPSAPRAAAQEEEALNLKDVEMRLIIQKIADWTGKVVIPTDEILKQKITIYAPGRLSRSDALEQIYGALRLKGYTAEHADKTIYLKPIRDARIGVVPAIAPEEPLAAIENKEQIVQKFFRLAHYRPSQMVQIVQPLIGEYGHINADEMTSSLSIIDTVRNLMRIETIIAQFDVPESDQITTEVFEVRNRAPGEIVQLLQILLSGTPRSPTGPGSSPRTVISTSSPSGAGADHRFRGRGSAPSSAASSTVVSGARSAIMLIAEPKFNWIIVKAAAEDMQEIRRWIERLDRQMPTIAAEDSLEKIENKNQIVQRFIKLTHVSPDRMGMALRPLLSPAGNLAPEMQTNTLIVVDTVETLLRLERIVAQFDVPPEDDMATQIFELQHREPEEVITLLGALLGEGVSGYGRSMGTVVRDRSGRMTSPTHILRVDRARFSSSRGSSGFGGDPPVVFIGEPRSKWIIVKARPGDMETIAAWIRKLDTALPTIAAADALDRIENKNQIVQRFIKLTHLGADRMQELLVPMLSSSGRMVPELNTNTLLIVDAVENLLRMEEIVAHFDVPPRDDLITKVIELQAREPEEIATLLSAVLGEGGGPTSGFYGRSSWSSGSSSGATRAIRIDRARPRSGHSSSVPGVSEQPIVLIPDPQRKWIIVKARPEDVELVAGWIQRLDKPVVTVTAELPLTEFENRNQVVQRFLKLKHYDPM